jgi:hypothetical protein
LSVNTPLKFFSTNNIKDLIIYDTAKFKSNKKTFLTKVDRDYIILTKEEKTIIIGLLLSDG